MFNFATLAFVVVLLVIVATQIFTILNEYERGVVFTFDNIAQKHRKIILLTDWDWRGGRLGSTIKKHLENRVECKMRYRQMFAQHCMCRTVEGIPSWLQTLQKKIQGE